MAEKPAAVLRSYLVADFIFQALQGKWCIIGVFNRIFSPVFPAIHQSLGLFLSLTDVPPGEHKVGVVFFDSDHRQLAVGPKVGININDRLAQVDIGIQTYALVLPHPGDYFFEVLFDDTPIGDARISAMLMPKQGGNT